MTIFSLVSIISLLCASHGRRKKSHHTKIEEGEEEGEEEEETSTTNITATTTSCQSDKKLLKKLNSSISSKTHHLMVKMISWRKKVRDEEGEENEDEDYNDEAIWRRKIIMGERCRPFKFSGEISYDCEGNLLPNESVKRNQNCIST
ncbi:hypothetical protein ACOSP7_026267 [Xanthoceras sorbifolium]